MTGNDGGWRLMRRGALLGTITITEADFPWLRGRFTPEPAFAEVRPWFEAVLALLEAEVHDERFDAAYEPIPQALALVSPNGPVADFLLHIDGEEAWFRWSDEPPGA
ncbi:hypothetical protein [Streptomyces subrutilus]|uniref:Uncharacterized protein n=1 Tax=Streptomyces subrutilus TaxID=36818 RepID=A0A1E5Q139_9ACTN|nr:hypothetical protein [Streptomyces subrutilus]OEJ35535.1 hypothetical protein BGK67_07405 [Streptomyces subrutilus]